jgi:hypothetical protein
MMLVPSRGGADEASGAPLAAGGLGAFLGFFHREFRAHDFALGRRNMQRFLQRHLALPAENALFAEAAVRPEGALAAAAKPGHLPVVPLLGRCTVEEPLPRWPAGVLRPERLAAPIRARMDAVAKDLLRAAPLGTFGGLAARGYWWWKRDELVAAALAAIRAALAAKKLA